MKREDTEKKVGGTGQEKAIIQYTFTLKNTWEIMRQKQYSERCSPVSSQYLKCIKNFQNPTIRNKQHNLKICVGQNISIVMSPNEIEGWQIDEKVLKHH